MKHTTLTAKYRPQTFAAVAGQETLKAILSRAAKEDKVAPAYLFSGTRGVGKTTLARVFAKSLNCRKAPAAEPCNTCDLCQAITLGSAIDVIEIDGASNRGIDDVRKLKEVVGYAPMDARYKIFIIDEAHMLSREAFNALLKTLEEPPKRVTFILATTEPHKFPATIISRCQHYVFKGLNEQTLIAHLNNILLQEQVQFEEKALCLIARRGAGSVRDSMSLLGQVLALGAGEITESSVRQVLGLAGQEAFTNLVQAIQQGNVVNISQLLRSMLDNGLDIGFFLRELVTLWRNLFILKQAGQAGLSVVDLPKDEAEILLTQTKDFSLSHIHACWQMSIEGQRRILTSVEPALGLELLLLNLAMLPQLLAIEDLSAIGRRTTPKKSPQGGTPPASNTGSSNENTGGNVGGDSNNNANAAFNNVGGDGNSNANSAFNADTTLDFDSLMKNDASSGVTLTSMESTNNFPQELATPVTEYLDDAQNLEDYDNNSATSIPKAVAEQEIAFKSATNTARSAVQNEQNGNLKEQNVAIHNGENAEEPHIPTYYLPTLEGLLQFATSHTETPPWFASLLQRIKMEWLPESLTLLPEDSFTVRRLNDPATKKVLQEALRAIGGPKMTLEITPALIQRSTQEEIKQEIWDNPFVQLIEQTFQAKIIDFGQLR